MKVIIAWDSDHIGREVDRASLADDVGAMRRISQNIGRGNEVWKSWVITNSGALIGMAGGEGRAEILAEKLVELPKTRDQYAQTVESTVSVGVGAKVSEADKALVVAKIRGGDRIVLYTPDIEAEIEQAEKAKQKQTETDKLAEESLAKGDVVPLNPPAPTGKKHRANAQVYEARPEFWNRRMEAHATRDPGLKPVAQGIHGAKSTFDYSHHLPEDMRSQGYALHVQTGENDPDSAGMVARFMHGDNLVATRWALPGLASGEVRPTTTQLWAQGHQVPDDAMAAALQAHAPYMHHLAGQKHVRERAAEEDTVYSLAPQPKPPSHLTPVGGEPEPPAEPEPEPAPQEPQDAQVIPFPTRKSEDGLAKAAGPQGPASPAMNGGPDAGFSGASRPQGPTVAKPKGEASEHSEGEAAQAMADNKPPAPEMTHSAQDLEELFHQMAQEQDAKDQGQAQGGNADEQLKAQVVQVLQALKAQAPILEQVKATAPDTYAAIMAMAQAVIVMAKRMNGDPGHQTVKETDDRARSQAQVEVPLPPEEGDDKDKDGKKEGKTEKSERPFDLSKSEPEQALPVSQLLVGKESLRQATYNTMDGKGSRTTGPLSVWKLEDGRHLLIDGHHRLVDHLRSGARSVPYHIAGEGYTDYYATPEVPFQHKATKYGGLEAFADSKLLGRIPVKKSEEDWDCEGFGHCWGTEETGDHCLLCGGCREELEPEDLDKASLSPNAGQGAQATHHHVILPVGSKDSPGPNGRERRAGRIKVLHSESNKEGWIEARAGQVLSHDGHPISARNPNGK